jgi:thymidylate synthase
MIEISACGATLPAAYHKALRALRAYGEITDCPDYNTKQRELSMTMVVEKPLKEPMISKLFIGGYRELEQYRQEMLDGILDFEVDKGNWAYTYHSRIAPQIPFIIEELRRNPYSRRAVVDVRDWKVDAPSSDPACLQHIQYFIRHCKLHCKVLFRSNDACKATFMNAFALIMLQKRIADELGLEVGTYTHKANSFHCYEQDFKLLDSYVQRASFDNATFNYVGEWDELMEEAKPEIAAMVEELRGRYG